MIYVNEDTFDKFETAEEAIDEAIENMDWTYYDEWLDELDGGEVTICGCHFRPSHILAECDPIAYRCGFDDFAEWLRSELEHDLDRYGDIDIFDIRITAYESITEYKEMSGNY